jgi:hypothetical protein
LGSRAGAEARAFQLPPGSAWSRWGLRTGGTPAFACPTNSTRTAFPGIVCLDRFDPATAPDVFSGLGLELSWARPQSLYLEGGSARLRDPYDIGDPGGEQWVTSARFQIRF